MADGLMRATATSRRGARWRHAASLLPYLEVIAALGVVLALDYYAGLDVAVAMVLFFATLGGLVALRIIAMRH